MKTSKKHKLNDAEIYCDLLLIIADIEGVNAIDITETLNIPEALERLGLGAKYIIFDLEATRRECECLRELLRNDGQKN